MTGRRRAEGQGPYGAAVRGGVRGGGRGGGRGRGGRGRRANMLNQRDIDQRQRRLKRTENKVEMKRAREQNEEYEKEFNLDLQNAEVDIKMALKDEMLDSSKKEMQQLLTSEALLQYHVDAVVKDGDLYVETIHTLIERYLACGIFCTCLWHFLELVAHFLFQKIGQAMDNSHEGTHVSSMLCRPSGSHDQLSF